MHLTSRLTLVLLMFAVLAPTWATAQPIPLDPAAAPAADPGAVAPLLSDPTVTEAAKALFGGIAHGQWGLVAFAGVILAVALLRLFGRKIHPKLGLFLDYPVVAWALPILVSVLGAILAALLAGQPIGVAIGAGINVGALAIAGFVGVKKVQEARELGKAAAAAVTDKAAAVSLLEKGPQP
jgi:hypothetical protein